MFTWFSKTGVPQKNHKRQYGLIHVALPQKFSQSLKGITVWPIFQKLMLFSISNAFKKLNQRQQISTHIVLKYYLHYKMMTFQNVSSEAQVKDVFISEKSYVPFSWYSSFFAFLSIPWFTKSVTSWWTLVHETGCIFEYIFWTATH